MTLEGKTVLLGVTGSIAAYKIAYLASALKKRHADVHVLMTENATNFINPITFETGANARSTTSVSQKLKKSMEKQRNLFLYFQRMPLQSLLSSRL